MSLLKKSPILFVILLNTLYYILYVLLFEPVGFSVKFEYILSAILVWFSFWVFTLAMGDRVKFVNSDIFVSKDRNNLALLSSYLWISLQLILVTSVFEYVIASIFIKGASTAIGFPFSIYSFSAGKIIIANLLADILINITNIMFLRYILMNKMKGNIIN